MIIVSKPKLTSKDIKEIQDLLESGIGVNEVTRKTGVSKAIVGSVYRKERVFCHICEQAHDGPRCPTIEERATAREEAKEKSNTPSSATRESELVTDNTISPNKVIGFQGGAGQ